MRFIFIACLFTALLIPQRIVPATIDHVVIENNRGGLISNFTVMYKTFEDMNVPVEIKGYCMSACGRFMRLKKVCAAPGAVFGFHFVRDANTDQIMIEEGWQDAEDTDLPLAYALERKYGSREFGFVDNYNGPEAIDLEPDVSIFYAKAKRLDGSPSYMKFLMIKAFRLIPPCQKFP